MIKWTKTILSVYSMCMSGFYVVSLNILNLISKRSLSCSPSICGNNRNCCVVVLLFCCCLVNIFFVQVFNGSVMNCVLCISMTIDVCVYVCVCLFACVYVIRIR